MSLLREPDFDIPLDHKKNLSLHTLKIFQSPNIVELNISAQHQSPADKGETSGVTSPSHSFFPGSLTLEAALAGAQLGAPLLVAQLSRLVGIVVHNEMSFCFFN